MRYAAALFAAAMLALTSPAAHAGSPISDNGHTHHLNTGNGGCVDIDAVRFLAQNRGLHQGANASGTLRGPWHGPC